MEVRRPSRISVAYIYYKRIIRWRRNNYPYVSGDCFADLADFVYKAPRFRDRSKNLESADVVFCRSHDLQEFLNLYGDRISAKVLITGNSDFEFHEIPTNLPKSLKALFLQNSFISDNNFIFTIPIGVEDFRLGVNGNPKYFRQRNPDIRTERKILIGPLSPTHPIRESVQKSFPKSDNLVEVLHTRLKPSEYDKLAKQYLAVAAVRGNGVDTHRLWESLYRGVTPIVHSDRWWDSLAVYFPDVVTIKEWSDDELIGALTKSENLSFEPGDVKPLWMPFWSEKIYSFLR